MLKALAFTFILSSIILPISADDNKFSHCDCDAEGLWSIASILECQKVSDFLIAVAYFSIPIELLYFVSCSNVPFKWVLLQFIAFIVLCGMTHLLNGWTYYGPHSFQLMLTLTIFKFLTALVSCATAITLLTLFPLLLKLKVRELFLRQNVLELDQEVGMMKRKKEACWHVRMLTQEIRKSLDKHTILYTTLVELSEVLDLQNCAVWMPNDSDTEMNLTHELTGRIFSNSHHISIPVNDPEVLEIITSEGVKILRPDSILGTIDIGGSAAAIRMPMLRVSNFKGGTPVLQQTCYAILVLVLSNSNLNSRIWSYHEMEIVEVVADQVAVALSHAAVLEESQMMREKLKEQNRALQEAKENALMASQAWTSFQKAMSLGMRRPMHSIMGLLSMIQDENTMRLEQRIILDTLVKASSVLSTLINDVMEITAKDNGVFPLEMRPFNLHSIVREASCLAKCLCVCNGFGFAVDVENNLPSKVMGDERRTFQVILHMVSHLLNINDGEGSVTFRVSSENGRNEIKNGTMWGMWRSGNLDECVYIKFEIEIGNRGAIQIDGLVSTDGRGIKEDLNFSMCKKLVQMMQGYIWISRNSEGLPQSMTLVLKFNIQSLQTPIFELGNSDQPNSNSLFRGLRVILVDDDDVNRTVTKKLLQKLGFQVTAVSSGFECVAMLGPAATHFQIVVLDLHMPEIDGFEVAMKIRKMGSRNRPLIIALTASDEDKVWERCLQTGMNGIIRKPVLLRVLADELRKILIRANDGF